MNDKLSDVDKLALELAKTNVKLAASKVQTAVAEQSAAELSYRNILLQIYVKYGLSSDTGIDDATGSFLKPTKQDPVSTRESTVTLSEAELQASMDLVRAHQTKEEK